MTTGNGGRIVVIELAGMVKFPFSVIKFAVGRALKVSWVDPIRRKALFASQDESRCFTENRDFWFDVHCVSPPFLDSENTPSLLMTSPRC